MEHNLLFIDTETSCFAEEIGVDTFKRPFINESGDIVYPHIIQVSWIITTSGGKELITRDFIIYPKDYTITESVIGVHGITNEIAKEKGEDIDKVIDILKNDIINYGCYKICGHNVKFDLHMLEAEALRLGDINFYNSLVNFHYEDTCTNTKIIHTVGLLNKAGKLKRPKLIELYFYLFGKDFSGAHNSLADITATKECFFECVNRGLIDQINFD